MSEDVIKSKANELKREINKLPRIVKDLGVQFFNSRFRAQGWMDQSFKKWPDRKKKDKKRPGRAILMNRGRLRNSIRGEVRGTDIVWGTDVPYARIHNDGGKIQRHARSELFVRNRYKRGKKGQMFGGKGAYKKGTTAGRGLTFKAHTINMPQRQFMGDSAHLRKIVERKIQTTLANVFK